MKKTRLTAEEHFTWMRRPTCCRAAEPAWPVCEVRGRSATTLSLYRWHDSVASLVLENFIFSVLEQQKERWPGPVDNIFPHLVILCMLNCCTGHCSYINRQYWHQTQTRARRATTPCQPLLQCNSQIMQKEESSKNPTKRLPRELN